MNILKNIFLSFKEAFAWSFCVLCFIIAIVTFITEAIFGIKVDHIGTFAIGAAITVAIIDFIIKAYKQKQANK